MLAAFGIASASSQPFTGRLSDRAGRRRAFVVGGLVLMAGLNLLLPFAGSMVTLFVLRLGQGMAAALTITASVALVSELSTRGTRGGNMGTFNSLRMLGFGSGPLVAGFVVSSGPYALAGIRLDGYDAAFLIAAAAALLSALLVLVFVHDPDHVRPTARKVDLSIRSRNGGVLDPVFALGISTFVMAGCVALLSPPSSRRSMHAWTRMRAGSASSSRRSSSPCPRPSRWWARPATTGAGAPSSSPGSCCWRPRPSPRGSR